MIEWLSANIYNKDNSVNVNNLTTKIDDQILLKQYDLGIHSNKVNKKYDMFRVCKLVCGKIISIMDDSIKLEYGDMWDKLDDQLSIEYPFYIDRHNVLPSDYHITDYFNITKRNMNKITKKWLKTPKDIADYMHTLGITEISYERLTHNGNATINLDIFPHNRDLNDWWVLMHETTQGHPVANGFLNTIYDKFDHGEMFSGTFCRDCEQKLHTINADGTVAGCPNAAPTDWYGTIDTPALEVRQSPKRMEIIFIFLMILKKFINTASINQVDYLFVA